MELQHVVVQRPRLAFAQIHRVDELELRNGWQRRREQHRRKQDHGAEHGNGASAPRVDRVAVHGDTSDGSGGRDRAGTQGARPAVWCGDESGDAGNQKRRGRSR